MLVARDVMTSEPVAVTPKALLWETVALLLERRWRAMPVVDEEGVLKGILAESDLLGLAENRRLLEQEAASGRFWSLAGGREAERHLEKSRSRTVGEVMTPHPLAIPSDLPVDRIAGMMAEHGFHLLPVIGGDGRLLGVVTRTDLLQAWWEGRLR